MSISLPLEIQRKTLVDDHTASLLRTFDLEWRCGTSLIWRLIQNGCPPSVMGQALTAALTDYQRMCREGVNDFIRLKCLLIAILNAICMDGVPPEKAKLHKWMEECNIPLIVREEILNVAD